MATLRALLEDAWDAQKSITGDPGPDLRGELRKRESAARLAVSGGSFSEVQANGRTSAFAVHGVGVVTPAEQADAYRELVDLYGESIKFLSWCAKWAFDAFEADRDAEAFQPGAVPVS